VGAGFMAEQSVTNKRTKHINLRYHYVREEISEFKNFEMEYIQRRTHVIFSLNHSTEPFLSITGTP